MDEYTKVEQAYKNGVAKGYKHGKLAADARNRPESPYVDDNVLACPLCGSGEYLHNGDGNRNAFCGQCGQAIDWEAQP